MHKTHAHLAKRVQKKETCDAASARQGIKANDVEAVEAEQRRHNVWATYRSGAWRQSAVGQVGAANVPEVREHEEGIADVWRGLEKSTILPPPENCETKAEWNFIHSFHDFIPFGCRTHTPERCSPAVWPFIKVVYMGS